MSNQTRADQKSGKTDTQNFSRIQANAEDLDTCTSDHTWAEHARPNDDGPDPCDDGRGLQFEK